MARDTKHNVCLFMFFVGACPSVHITSTLINLSSTVHCNDKKSHAVFLILKLEIILGRCQTFLKSLKHFKRLSWSRATIPLTLVGNSVYSTWVCFALLNTVVLANISMFAIVWEVCEFNFDMRPLHTCYALYLFTFWALSWFMKSIIGFQNKSNLHAIISTLLIINLHWVKKNYFALLEKIYNNVGQQF